MVAKLDSPAATSPRVGSILPITGGLSWLGPEMRDAADLAAEEISATGVLAGSLELLHRDSQTDPTAGAVAAAELVSVEGVPVIIGAAASSVSEAVAEITVPNEVVQISPSSTHPLFSAFEPEEPGWFWRTAASEALEGKAAALRALERGWTSVGILVIDDPFWLGAADTFSEHFTRDGGIVAVQVNFTEEQPDYTAELTIIASAAPDAVFLIAFPGDGLTIMQNWEANKTQPGWGWNWLFWNGLKSSDFMLDLQSAGVNATGVEGTAPILEGPNYAAFRTAFLARYGKEPEIFTANTYDALYLTALAAVAGQGNDSASIRDSLIDVANPPGTVVGPGSQEFETAVGILEAGGEINYEGASSLVNFNVVGDVGSSYEIWEVTEDYEIVQVDVIPEEVMWPGLTIIGPWFGSQMDEFMPVLDAFEAETGILTEYIATSY
ncbi:MAG: ABC transporter substrate-binding protein, partial [Anaerolineae bacterium]|nr:ABC transporter substrate-binding protein [Anaerolineae bacterium]NIN94959.1 ABC transporter substrate-binding protein [Anaerolineae bacterium]